MLILNTMTGATPETRLILIICLVRHQIDLQAATKVELDALGLSKRHLKEAYDYLVRERYFWTTRGLSPFAATVKTKEIIGYRFTATCLELWQKSIDECNIWRLEFLQLFTNLSFASSKLLLRPNSMRASMLLVWGMLFTKANQSGYVIGVDSLALQQILGMPKARIDRSLSALADVSCITLAAQGVARSLLFAPFKPIYRIHPMQNDKKKIKLGVDLNLDGFMPLRFIRTSKNEYKLARGRKLNKSKKPSDYYLLTDEQYYKLSKLFSDDKLSNYVMHLCLSIIFSLVSVSEIFYGDLSDSCDGESCNGEVMKRIKSHVSQEVNYFFQIDRDGSEYFNSPMNSKKIERDLLMTSALTALISDLCQIIFSMSKRWRTWTKKPEISDARIIGYLPKYKMKYTLKNNDKPSNSDLEEEKEDKIIAFSLHVFEVYVPNRFVICDCVATQEGVYAPDVTFFDFF